jgi:hypothetical protein
MATFIEKRPALIRNAIAEQLKQAANSLTIKEWNDVVNTLKLQTNVTVEYLEKLHRVLFGVWSNNTEGLNSFEDQGVINTLLEIITNAKDLAVLKTNFFGKCDQEEGIVAGDLVMFGGAEGDHIKFLKANLNAANFINEWIMGIAETSMSKGDFGNVRWFGEVTGLPINFVAGTILWADNTPGSLTPFKPVSGPRILIAAVIKPQSGNSSNGVILVRPTLSGAGELDTDTAQDGDFLRFDEATGHYKNVALTKLVASQSEPLDNKNNDIWFDF